MLRFREGRGTFGLVRRDRPLALLLAAVLALAPITTTPVFAAEPTAADLESARDLFKKGRALREKGDLPSAIEKFKAAHALATTPITGLELGRTYLEKGDLVEARDAFLSVGRIPIKLKESDNARSAREEAAKLAREVEPRIPSLAIAIQGPTPSQTALTIDDVQIPSAAIGEPRRLNPGKHVVVATVIGGKDEKRLEIGLSEGDHKTITIELEPPPPGTPEGPLTPESEGPVGRAPVRGGDKLAEPSGPSAVTWIGFGIAGAGAVVGTITGLTALSRANSAKERCVDKLCPPEIHGTVDSGKTMGNISTVAFAVAGVGATIGILGLLGVDKKIFGGSAQRRVQPMIGLGTFGLSGSF
jgi:hypothetical protein